MFVVLYATGSLWGLLKLAALLFTVASALLWFKQEQMLYVPAINGMHKLADMPEQFRSPRAFSLNFEAVSIPSGDCTLACWLIKAGKTSQTVRYSPFAYL